jgi:ribosomal protein L40E
MKFWRYFSFLEWLELTAIIVIVIGIIGYYIGSYILSYVLMIGVGVGSFLSFILGPPPADSVGGLYSIKSWMGLQSKRNNQSLVCDKCGYLFATRKFHGPDYIHSSSTLKETSKICVKCGGRVSWR